MMLTVSAEQIKRVRRSSQTDHEFSIFWIPRRTLVSDQILEESGVLGEVNVAEYPLYFVSLADDLVSLELDDAVLDLYLVFSQTLSFSTCNLRLLAQGSHSIISVCKGTYAYTAEAWTLPPHHR